jgi:hypothetical protein
MIHYHIILPTYYYYKGTKKILEQIYKTKTKTKNLSLYIFDNTINDKIRNLYLSFRVKLNIIYFKNRPSISAVTNWNKSLSYLKKKLENQLLGTQDYFIILHHDEYFTDKDFFLKLNKLIKINDYPDVISMTTIIDYNNKLKNKIHTTSYQRFLFHKYYFDYILLRNFIGPVSSLVIKSQNNFPTFDKNLKWLVDVEYYKKIKMFKKWIFTDDLILYSDQKNDVSLTLKYKLRIKDLYLKERNQISHKFNLNFIFLDYIIWAFLRISNKFKYFINIKKYLND